VFLDFALGCGAITRDEHLQHHEAGWETLGSLAQAQAQYFAASEPTARFFALLRAAIDRGTAHVAYMGGETPATPELWGWQRRTVGTGDFERTEWQPQGERIGWIDQEHVYLQPDVAFATLQKMACASDELFAISARTLRKRLYERGMLASVEQHGDRVWLLVRRQIQGDRRHVLHVRSEHLSTTEWSQWSQSGPQTAPPISRVAPIRGSKIAPSPDMELSEWAPELETQTNGSIGSIFRR
jgi:hypothetical protein